MKRSSPFLLILAALVLLPYSEARAECDSHSAAVAYWEAVEQCDGDKDCLAAAQEAWEGAIVQCISEGAPGPDFSLTSSTWTYCPSRVGQCNHSAQFTWYLCMLGPNIVLEHCINHCFPFNYTCSDACERDYLQADVICDSQAQLAFNNCMDSTGCAPQ